MAKQKTQTKEDKKIFLNNHKEKEANKIPQRFSVSTSKQSLFPLS